MLKYLEALFNVLVLVLFPGIGSIVLISVMFNELRKYPNTFQIIGYILIVLSQFAASVSFWMAISGKI
jgi:hypothetical protein